MKLVHFNQQLNVIIILYNCGLSEVEKKYLEQSTVGETVKGNETPQLLGSACASAVLTLRFFDAFLMQLQAVCLSAVVVAEVERVETPAQHGEGGFPLPLVK